MKIFFWLFIITFWACSNSTTYQDLSDMDLNASDNYVSNISIIEGKYKVDTNAILNNNNLSLLIEDIEKADLSEKKTVAEIPAFIKSFLNNLTDSFSIANPDEEWRVGCVSPMEIDNSKHEMRIDPKTGDTIITVSMKAKNIPARQLIYFGLSDDVALMTYYTGGVGKSEHILIVKFDNNKIVDFWCGNILTDVTNKVDILEYLKSNKDKEWGLNTSIIYL